MSESPSLQPQAAIGEVDETVALPSIFERWVRRQPDATALCFGEQRISYADLDRRANRLAHTLRRRGVGPEVRVALCLDRSPEMVVAVLGVLKAGGAYVPLDPAYPRDRLTYMLEDSRAALLLSAGDDAEGLAPRVLRLDVEAAAIASEPAERPPAVVDADQTAYVIYTSGSTGRPKGVMVPHRGLMQVHANQASILGVGPEDRVLQFASWSFDASVFEWMMSLGQGASLCLAPPRALLPGDPLAATLRRHRVTVVTLPPSALAGLPPDDLPDLRVICSAGEACSRELVDRWAPGRRFFNLYGPTEATIWSTTAQCRPGGGTPSIGVPNPGTRVFLLHPSGGPAVGGEAGEIVLGGTGISRGYLGKPGLTAERFVPDPRSGTPGARLYRTGDRARLRADGEVDYLGRLDHQVKLRGFRIELGEIEAALAGHPAVAEGVVVLRQDPTGDPRLVAYVVPGGTPEVELAPQELRAFLAEALPDYMVPAVVVVLPELPLTPNGKVDRKALPAPPRQRPESGIVAPRTATERRVAEVMGELLWIDPPGPEADFFELGGHSLLATRLLAGLRERFGIDVPLEVFFDAPTVAALARHLDESLAAGAAARLPALRREPRDRPIPLSLAQERVVFLQQLEPDNLAYQFQNVLHFDGALDVDALRRSLDDIVRRHEIYRTSFAESDGERVQVIHPPCPAAFELVDLSHLDASEAETEARRRQRQLVHHRFDLDRLPLVSWTLYRLTPRRHQLLHLEHHLTHDGWSYNLFLRELLETYEALARGEGPPLPVPEVQFADFAIAQRRWSESEEAQRQLEYWTERLAGCPPLEGLPYDRPLPPRQTFRGGYLKVDLPGEDCDRLRDLCRRQGATLFMGFFAVFLTLLHRWTGQKDLAVGTAVGNRRWPRSEGLYGMLVNNVVLRHDVAGGQSFRELLADVRRVALAAWDHQELTFERIVEALKPERDPSRNPIFQTSFSFHDSPLPRMRLDDLRVRLDEETHNASAKFELNVIGIPRLERRVLDPEAAEGRGVYLAWEYNSDLFDEATMRRMGEHFHRLLAGAAASPDAALEDLPLLSPQERRQVLEVWSTSRLTDPDLRPVHLRTLEAAAARPEAPAAVALTADGARTMSYGELAARAHRLADRLRRLGAGPEARIAVFADRSPELLVAELGVLAAGAAYLPLDPAYPADRIAYILADAAVAAVVTTEDLEPRLPEPAVPRLILGGAQEAGWEEVPGGTAFEVPGTFGNGREPRQLAYVIYTSGSTGRPKGVEISHGGLARLVAWHQATYGVGGEDRATLVASPAFDASVWETWPYLTCGACLLIPDAASRTDPAAMVELLAEHGTTVSFLPTPLAQATLEEEWPESLPLRALLTGGDALRRRPAPGLPFRLINHYGPTESTVVATAGEVAPAGSEVGSPPIGRPIGDLALYVVDTAGRPVPPGAPGELLLSGPHLARGYLGRPALTAQSFVPDPFAETPGERLYRTGDLVRWLPDGRLAFLGRRDAQVKVRGFRIELGEVEAALASHPGVAEAAVVAPTGADGERWLAGFWTATGAPVDGERLRAFLTERLPEALVPAVLLERSALPLTPHGKVDRRTLEAEAAVTGPARTGAGFVAPRTPMEEVLAGLWAEVLGVERAGVHDDFFQLGGHSLMATRLVSRVRSSFAVELPLAAFFAAPTVARLAAVVEAARASGDGASAIPLPPLEPASRRDPLPLSFAQERLWFLDRILPLRAAYNIPFAVRLRGPLDVAILERALTEIIRRHETLRTTFPAPEGTPVQQIRPPTPVELPLEDLSALPPEEQAAELRRRIEAAAWQELDLAQGPLFTASLLRLGTHEHRLLLVLHHIVADAWSLDRLFAELAALYGAFCRGEPSPLSPLPVQYADYAVWQRGWLEGELLEEQLDFWRARLAGAPTLLELPTDRPRPPVASYRGAVRSARFSRRAFAELRELARRRGTTPFIALLAVLQALLGRLTRQNDLTVGAPISGRRHERTEGLLGFFLNTLVLRGDLSGDPTGLELLDRVKETVLDAFSHQDLPFEKLVQELEPQRSLAHTPLFQVAFVYLEASPTTFAAGDLELAPEPVEIGTSKFDLTFNFTADGDRLSCDARYSTDLFDTATVDRFLAAFGRLLEGFAGDPARRPAELPLLDAGQRRQLLSEWQGPASDQPLRATLPELFEAQTARTPQAVALVCGDRSLRYGELDRLANRLARRLVSLGVGPEVVVGLAAERSLETMVALLAILKAGGAYLPLDPTYPAERLAFLLDDLTVPLLLTRPASHPRLVEAVTSRRDGGGPAPLVVRLEDGLAEVADESPESLPRRIGADHLAYVMYTSGSTGRPKGVGVVHRNVARLVREADWARLDSSQVFLQFAPLSFDASTLEIWAPLLHGGRLVLYPHDQVSLPELGALLRQHQVSTLWLTAALFHQMVESDLEGLRPVRQLLAGGDVLSPAAVRKVLEALPETTVINGYGPTENTTFTCCHPMTAPEQVGKTVSIGRPISNTRVYVLDTHLEPVLPGVVGELYTGGDGVARGYLGRPGLTAERFVPDPFSARPGARLYRIGDLARWLPDGTLEFLGRTDHQVKVRGFRIELGEIEAVLAEHPAVRQCVVTVAGGRSGEPRLLAYAVPQGSAVDVGELRQHLRQRLPEYMIPAAWVLLDALPVTPNGKVDRRALPQPDAAEVEHAGEHVGPRTAAEELLAALWKELLEVDRVGVGDNFFDLGGHSLHAARHMYRLQEMLDLDLPVRTLFEAQTLEDLAGRLEAVLAEAAGGAEPARERLVRARDRSAYREAIPRRPDPQAPSPLSWSEEILWYVEQQATMPPGIYRFAPVLDLEGPLDEEALRRTFHALAARHEIFRTRFGADEDGTSWQVADASMTIEVAALDVSRLPEDERRMKAQAAIDELAGRRFDLTRCPMVRPLLVRLERERHWLLLSIHHIVLDDWGFGVLFRDLSELYTAFTTGREPQLPELAIQYADYALWDRQRFEGEFLERLTTYWRGRFADGLPQLRFATDRPRPPLPSYRGTYAFRELPRELSKALRRRAREEEASLFMVLLAGLKLLLARWSHWPDEPPDVMVAVAHANRPRKQTEELLGSFFNLLLMRTSLAGDPTLRQLLDRVKDTALEAYAHQDFPFILVAPGYSSPDIPPGKPPVQALFSFQNTPPHKMRFAGLEVREVILSPYHDIDIDLLFSIRDHAEDLKVILLYDTDIFEAATVQRRLAELERFLAALAHEPDRRLSEVLGDASSC